MHHKSQNGRELLHPFASSFTFSYILGDPGTDSGGEGKSKRAGKYGRKEK